MTPGNTARSAGDGEPTSQNKPSRYTDQELLDHPSRQAIVDLLAERPGMNLNQIHHALNIELKVLDHHLRRLADGGILFKLDSAQDKEHLYFLAHHKHHWENERTRILFGREPTRNVALYIAENPGCSAREIAGALDCSIPTIHLHVNTLRDFELITRGSWGRHVEYHPLEPLREWVNELGDRYPVPWREGGGE